MQQLQAQGIQVYDPNDSDSDDNQTTVTGKSQKATELKSFFSLFYSSSHTFRINLHET